MIQDLDLERTRDLQIDRIEIVTDSDANDRIEIYILDSAGERIEGGTFSRSDFMTAVLAFYNANY